MDDEVTQPAENTTLPAQPAENTETKPETTEAVAATPAEGTMPEQPSPASVSSDLSAETSVKADPEAAQPAADFPGDTSASGAGVAAPAPQTQTSGVDLNSLRQKANAKRTARRADSLQRILSFASTNPSFSNQNIRDLLHVSQSSVSSYLTELVKSGKLKREGRARAARYSLV